MNISSSFFFRYLRSPIEYNLVSFIVKVNGKLNIFMVISVFEVKYCTTFSFAVGKVLEVVITQYLGDVGCVGKCWRLRRSGLGT